MAGNENPTPNWLVRALGERIYRDQAPRTTAPTKQNLSNW